MTTKAKRLLKNFERAVRQMETRGSQRPADHEAIITNYYKTHDALITYITTLEEKLTQALEHRR